MTDGMRVQRPAIFVMYQPWVYLEAKKAEPKSVWAQPIQILLEPKPENSRRVDLSQENLHLKFLGRSLFSHINTTKAWADLKVPNTELNISAC